MTSALTSPASGAREIGPLEAAQLLARAVQDASSVRLSVVADPTIVAEGTIVRREGECLFVAVVNADQSVIAELADAAEMRITFMAESGHASFVTRCDPESSELKRGQLCVDRPNALTLSDRRRSPRRKLYAAVEVDLYGGGERTDALGRSTLLNVSEGGLACRVDASTFQKLCVHEHFRVVFPLVVKAEPFDLDARIVSVTEGGSADVYVLGLEFIDNQRLDTNRARLAEIIQHSGRTGE